MNISKKLTLSVTTLASLLLVACSNTNQQATPASSSSSETSSSQSTSSMSSSSSNTSTSSSSTAASATTPAQTSELDGTYKGRDEEDEVTLVITGTSGTWTTVEPDGDQEIKQVTIDPTNQRIYIGDDTERYYLNGNQLTIEDISQDDENDTVILTKS